MDDTIDRVTFRRAFKAVLERYGAVFDALAEYDRSGTIPSSLRGTLPSMIDAAQRALSMVGKGTYWLGAGGYLPGSSTDSPFALVNGRLAADCSSFALWCHKLAKHRPGFNKGAWATVADDINTDSITEDAMHNRELFELVTGTPAPGDLIVYRSIWYDASHRSPDPINDEGRGARRWIGHVGVVVDVPPAWGQGEIASLAVVHCHGPQGGSPAVSKSDGSIWAHHTSIWNDDGLHPFRAAMLVRVKS